MFMNTWDIDQAIAMHRNHPVLSKATKLLGELRDLANATSDGWAYWPKPCRAAKKLQELIQQGHPSKRNSYPCPPDATEADLRKAIIPIKAFFTKHYKGKENLVESVSEFRKKLASVSE